MNSVLSKRFLNQHIIINTFSSIILLISIALLSCKKGQPDIKVDGSYHIVLVEQSNNGNWQPLTIPSCDQNANYNFNSSGSFSYSGSCDGYPVTGTWFNNSGYLFIKNTDAAVKIYGKIDQLTSKSFLLYETISPSGPVTLRISFSK